MPTDPVFLNSQDRRLRDLATPMKRAMKKEAVAKLFPTPRPGWRLPDRHSLRRACSTALAQVAPYAVVMEVIGHEDGTVTSRYVTIPLDEQIAALNRAALLIDDDPNEKKNVVPISRPRKMSGTMSRRHSA